MPFTTQFLPFAIETNALVLPQQTYGSETWLINGFGPGIADPTSCNTVWRQGSFVAAGITQWLANSLSRNINDDGNLSNFVTLFGSAIIAGAMGGVTSFNTRTGAVLINSTDITSALGYTPVRSFNTRNGAVVLTSSDVTNALGYIPVNKGGDTMVGLLSGPNPVAPSNYATKGYVDNAIGSGGAGGPLGTGITGNSSEYTFPLGDGGFLKVGQYLPSGGLFNKSAIVYNFATPFPTLCSTVNTTLISPTATIDNSWALTVYTNTPSAFSSTVTRTGFVLGVSGPWDFPSNPNTYSPPGLIWTALGY